MKKIVRNIATTTLVLFITAGACVQAAPGGRLTATYIGPITVNDGNGPRKTGIPDSVTYSYSGSRAVYDVATTYELDTVNHTAKVISIDNYTYTAADSFLTDVTQTVANGVATNSARLSRAYDGAGNDTLLLNESWNAGASAWVASFRTLYTFNAARQITGLVQQTWSTSASTWTNFNRFVYQYDATGRDSVRVQQKWIAATGTWKNVTLNTTLYTSFNKIASISSQRWSDTTAVWKDSTGIVNHYNSSNEIQSMVISAIFYGGRALWADSLATLTHSASGSPLVQIFYQKDFPFASHPYIPNLRYTYSYNAANQRLSNQTELIDNMYVSYNSLTGYYQYNSSGQATLQEPVSTNATNGQLDKEQYRFYYEAATAVPRSSGFAAGGIKVYPSPAAYFVTLSLTNQQGGTIEGALADITGKIWYQWSEPASANYSRRISVAALPAGVYYLRLSIGQQTASTMLVVQH